MNDQDIIEMLVGLLQAKHASPAKVGAGEIHATVAIRAALARQPVQFELARIVDAALTFLVEEIGRTRDVGDYLDQLDTLLRFQEVTAAGYSTDAKDVS